MPVPIFTSASLQIIAKHPLPILCIPHLYIVLLTAYTLLLCSLCSSQRTENHCQSVAPIEWRTPLRDECVNNGVYIYKPDGSQFVLNVPKSTLFCHPVMLLHGIWSWKHGTDSDPGQAEPDWHASADRHWRSFPAKRALRPGMFFASLASTDAPQCIATADAFRRIASCLRLSYRM